MSHCKRGCAIALGTLSLLACNRETSAAQPIKTTAVAPNPSVVVAAKSAGNKLSVDDIGVLAKGLTQVRLVWSVPPGTTVNIEAPAHVRWHSSDGLASAPKDLDVTGDTLKDGVPLVIEITGGATRASLSGVIKLVVCDDVNHAVCTPVTRDIQLGFVPSGTSPKVDVAIPLPSAK